MNAASFPRAFRDPSKRLLRGPVPEHFEQFYRETLRWRPGARLRSAEVKARYDSWVKSTGAPTMHERDIKRAMLNIGHTHFHSNRAWFGHAQLAAAVPDLPDNFPEAQPFKPEKPNLVERIDRIAVELEQLRREAARAA